MWAAVGGNRRLELTASVEDGVALLSFDELCGARLGAADYSALAASFHTIFVATSTNATNPWRISHLIEG